MLGKCDLFLPHIDQLPKIRFQATNVGIVGHCFGKRMGSVHRKFQVSLKVMCKETTDS